MTFASFIVCMNGKLRNILRDRVALYEADDVN
jgi:hypothetical protein